MGLENENWQKAEIGRLSWNDCDESAACPHLGPSLPFFTGPRVSGGTAASVSETVTRRFGCPASRCSGSVGQVDQRQEFLKAVGMKSMRYVLSGILVLSALMVGCSDITGTVESREIGVFMGVTLLDPVISLPDTVNAGEAFQVGIVTYGGGCHRKGEVEKIWTGGGVTLTPYDYRNERRRDCSIDIQAFDHVAEVTFTEPGVGIVRIQGREATMLETRVVTFEVVVL